MLSRFYITGCQRSGTTLVRLILESHPRVECLDETKAYDALCRGEVPEASDGITHLGYKIPRWCERLLDEGGDLPSPGFYRGEPVLFLLRDARDTVASMIALKQGRGPAWIEAWGRPILESWIEDEGFRRRYEREIRLLRSWESPRAAIGALYWLAKTSAFFDYEGRGPNVLGLSYEGLVHDPRPRLVRALAHLGLEWDEAVMKHPSAHHGELFPDGTTVGGTDPHRAIHASSVGLWRERLTAEEAEQVDAIAGEMNARVAAYRGL